MLSTVALLAAMSLSPAQGKDSSEIEFKNIRFTHGIYGQARKSDKYLPGDVVCLGFDVQGLKVKENGDIKYSMGFQVTRKDKDGKEKSVQKRDSQELTARNSLGGNGFPSFAIWQVSRDEEPGEYTMVINVEDTLTEKKAVLKKSFTVTDKKDFGLITTRITGLNGNHAPAVAVPGQQLELHWAVVGAEADKKSKENSVHITVQILENGKPVISKPYSGDVKGDSKENGGVMMFHPYLIDLNRPGKFQIELTAKCNNSKQAVKETLDLTVLDVK